MGARPTDGSSLDDLTALFLDLVRIPSPSGDERAIADWVAAKVRALGFQVLEDDTAAQTGAGAGNLLVRVPGAGEGLPILLCAHLDTVPVRGEVVPIIDAGVVRTDGHTILGADNKAAVAALLALLASLAERPPAGTVEVLFTMSEEVSLRGSAAFDASALTAKAGFVIDSSGPVGQVIVRAPTHKRIEATFRGAAAHAGIEPERGRSAISAAARAVASMRLGRLDEGTTANIGTVAGGVAQNIVPEECTLVGEIRALEPARLAEEIAHMLHCVSLAAAEVGTDAQTAVTEQYVSFALPRTSPPARIAATALRSIGVEPRFVATGGGSDANTLNRAGLPTVNMSSGYLRPHSPEERMPLGSLLQVCELVHAIVVTAAWERE